TGGTIHGSVFIDANGDGVRQTTEVGQATVIIFIDSNGNGKFDPGTNGTVGEPATYTNGDGFYSLKVAQDGDYPVLEVVPLGYAQTAPIPAPGPVHVAGGATVEGPTFGNQHLPPPPPTGGYI